MASPLETLIAAGTKLWLDSIDPDLVQTNRQLGASGATSNPIIVSNLIKSGRFDEAIEELITTGHSDGDIAWNMTDRLVSQAQEVFMPVWQDSQGDDGYVSFELDPLLEDLNMGPPHEERVAAYIDLGKRWSAGHLNRMIKVPATPAGLEALEPLAAAGVTLNVTLIFSMRQYEEARNRIWAGAQKLPSLEKFKSVYSIFVSRLDVYTEKHVPELSPEAQGQVGIVNAKRIWQANRDFWQQTPTKLHQEMIFASTGVKKPEDPPWKYVEAFAGSDIETNPPETNEKVEQSGRTITANIESMPPQSVLDEIDQKVDMEKLERVLMEEGLKKFADPQHALLKLIAEKRATLTAT